MQLTIELRDLSPELLATMAGESARAAEIARPVQSDARVRDLADDRGQMVHVQAG